MDIEAFKNFVIPVPENPDKINIEACKECVQSKSPCCACLPCYLSPDEIIDKSYQEICNLIDTGLVSLDWWEGNPQMERGDICKKEDLTYKGFFLRMRAFNAPIIHPASLKWKCILYDPTVGCALPYTHRPKGGRDLLPPQCKANPSNKCIPLYDKRDCAIDWIPYHDVLQQVYMTYKDNLDGVVMSDDFKAEQSLGWLISSLISKLDDYDKEQES